ncbi:MAG: aminoacyl--tRNA ligase-related protein [Clostridia bacterium]
MRLSNLNIKKINLKDIEKNYSGQNILMKLGELYQYESGIYGYGNLWTKLERIVEDIIIDELDKVGCIQVEFPKLQPKKVWEKSNRWNLYTEENDIMFTLNNNLGEYGLAPTAEECATIFGANRLMSYKNLPAIYYQIGEKFRKEIRTRGYLFRPRTFVMMDAYSFDKNEEDMNKTYDLMHQAYLNIFKRLGIQIIPTVSDNGTMGGKIAEEFQAITDLGEDIVLYDKENNIGINKEILLFENKDKYLQQIGIKDLSNMEEYNSVELGNNFQLGTKYSESMNLFYKDENENDKPYYMGCYGIGLGRIIAIILENNIIREDDEIKGFSLPLNIAPYKIQIIYKEDKKDSAEKLYDILNAKGIKSIIDDRKGYSLGSKIKDVYTLGTPYIAIIGDKSNGEIIEVEETKTGNKFSMNINEIEKLFNKNNIN